LARISDKPFSAYKTKKIKRTNLEVKPTKTEDMVEKRSKEMEDYS